MKPTFSFTLFAFAACTSEEGVKVYNNDPEATITSHASTGMILFVQDFTHLFVKIIRNRP